MGRYILVADSGATKTEWKLVGKVQSPSFFTKGISPYHMDQDQILSILSSELPKKIFNKPIEQIRYYGTGCKTRPKAAIVNQALSRLFPDAKVHVTHDLMGACIAASGNEKGIVCIMGTGSNSCYYNGHRIVVNSPGLGYILGDEGSGAYLGKKLLQHFLYDMLDKPLLRAFLRDFETNRDEILHKVYREPNANRFLASFTPFLSAQRGHFMIENIIEDGLRDFFEQHLNSYPQRYEHPVHFVGSIAFHFQDKIAELCKVFGFQLGKVLKQPMGGLATYHKYHTYLQD